MNSNSAIPSSSDESSRLQLVLEATSDGVFDWHIPSGKCFFSPRLYTMLGYEDGDFPGHIDSWRERVMPEDLSKAEELLKLHIADEQVPYKVEFRMRQKDGSWKWILARGKVVEKDAAGRPVRMLGTHIDISERKVAEERFRRLIESLPTGFALHEVIQDDSGKVVDYRYLQVNPAFERITGLSAANVLGKTFREIHPEADASSVEAFGNVALTGVPLQQEIHVESLDKWYETWVYPATEGQFAVLFNNITGRKLQEQAIKRSEEQFRFLAENAIDVVIRLDPQGNYLWASPSLFTLFGRDPDTCIGTSPLATIHPDDRDRVAKILEEAISSDQPCNAIYRHQAGSGKILWVESIGKAVRDPSTGIVREILVSTRDITARMEAEERYRKLFENLTTGFALHEVILDDSGKVVDYRFLEVNPAYERITGLTASRILGKRVLETLPNVEPYWIENFGRVALSGEPLRFENFTEPIGKWYETWAYRPAPNQFAVLVTDVTERKNQEEAIRLSEIRFREVADMSLDMLSRHDLNGIAIWTSPACRQILGIEPEATIGRTAFDFIVEEDKDSVRGALAKLMEQGRSSLQYRIRRTDGSVLWAESLWSLTRNADGSPFEIHCSTRDIGERKRQEEALRRSEEQFRFLAENSLDIVLRLDAEGRCLWVSPSIKAILGEDPAALVGTSSLAKVHPDDQPLLIESFRKIAVKPGASKAVFRHVKDSGEIVWLESIGKAIFDSSTGQQKEILISTRDVTERIESQRKIEELAAFNQKLFDSAGAIVVVFDRSGEIVRMNPAAEETFGWIESEVVGRKFYDLFVPAERRTAITKEFESPETVRNQRQRFEADWVSRDGSHHWISWVNSEILDDSGRLKYVVGTGLDRTRQRQAEQDLVELNASLEWKVQERTAELQIAVKELEAFSYSISHDLRSPLRAIDGFSLALIEDAGPSLAPELRNYLDRIRSASTHMAHLIDDLLELSRSSRVEIRKSEVDLSVIAHEILEGLHNQNPARSLFTKVDPDIRVQGDPVLVRSILDNLLGNSWKYSSIREETVIEVTSEIVEGRRWVQVKDNGIGFDMEHAGKLFGTFQRLHHGTQFEGTGIGLATVRKLVERHGGTITGSGIPDKGAVFRFTLDPIPGNSR